MKLTDSSVEFHIDTLLKQSKPGRHLSVINLSSYQDRQLCVVTHLHKYINATRDLRKSVILLISYQKPHGPVTTDDIARWLKTVLRNSGINTDVYSTHSTRSASTSAASANGCNINEILTHVGWSYVQTFATYYN